jgi:O-antigen/teichoic acid export membrane protein
MTALPTASIAPTAIPKRGGKLYRDAAALASSSMLTAVLGMGFWAICARVVPPAELGVQTALLSIIVAPALVVASGVGDAFTALVPASGPARAAVVRRGYRMLLVMAATAGAVAAVVAVTALPQVRGSIGTGLLVFTGVLIWSLFVVQDPALTSMRRAHWLPPENGSVSIAKIAALPVAMAIGIFDPVVVATLIPSVIAVCVLFPYVRRTARTLRDDGSVTVVTGALDEMPTLVTRTTTSVALSLGTLTVTPFMVTAAAGPVQGAVFSLCLSIVQALDFVGAAMGVSLVVHAAANAHEAGRMALSVFKRTVTVVGAGALVLVVVAPYVLRVLNARYIDLHGPAIIAILAVGSFARSIYVIWAALQRARRRMRDLLLLNSVAAAFVFSSMTYSAHRWGAVGAAGVIAGAQLILSVGALAHLAFSPPRDPVTESAGLAR